MSAVPATAAPTRSAIEGWPSGHLDEAAAHLRNMGGQSVTLFERNVTVIDAPGGTEWSGTARDAAYDRAVADRAVVRAHAAVQAEAADIAESGGQDVRAAQRAALEAITAAEADGFRVGEDLSVTDTRRIDLATAAARHTTAAEHAENIRWTAERLTQADAHVGRRLQAKATELLSIRFHGEDDQHHADEEHHGDQPTVHLVDHETKLSPPDKPSGDGQDHPSHPPGMVGPFAIPPSSGEAKPGDKPPGTLDDLLNPTGAPPGEPTDPQAGGPTPPAGQAPPPSALDRIINQHTGKGDGQDKPYTRSPLTSPIVAADPSVVDRQAARVDAARHALDDAQAKADAGAKQGYTNNPGAGPSRDEQHALGQAVFDARRDLTQQTAILGELNNAATETGAHPPAPIPPLPPNADVQAFPPPPSEVDKAIHGLTDSSHDMSAATFGIIPDVAHDAHTLTHFGEATPADRAQAIADAAGMVPLPGMKLGAEGLEHLAGPGAEALSHGTAPVTGRELADHGVGSAHVGDATPPAVEHHVDPPPVEHHGYAPTVQHDVPSPLPHDSPLFDGYHPIDPGPQFTHSDGSLIYPDDSLASKPYAIPGTVVPDAHLPAGTELGRFGYPGGGYLAPDGTPFAQLALPPESALKPYFHYEVDNPGALRPGWHIEESQASSWFHQPGGGTQYRVIAPPGVRPSVEALIDMGYLKVSGGR